MANDGWGKAFNPRDAVLTLRHRDTGAKLRLGASNDDRAVLPKGGEVRTFAVGGSLPTSMQTGRYKVFLSLEDPLLRDRPAYSIELANANVWRADKGRNALGIVVTVT